MPHSPAIVVNTLTRSFAIGISAGMRTMMPGAVVTWQIADGGLKRGAGPVWSFLRRDGTRKVALVTAVGELVGDKLPITPSRIEGNAGRGRLVIGAMMGGLVASGLGARSGGLVIAVATGALGGAVGSYGGFYARKAIVKQYSLPDLPVALVEDAFSYALARLAVAQKIQAVRVTRRLRHEQSSVDREDVPGDE